MNKNVIILIGLAILLFSFTKKKEDDYKIKNWIDLGEDGPDDDGYTDKSFKEIAEKIIAEWWDNEMDNTIVEIFYNSLTAKHQTAFMKMLTDEQADKFIYG